MGSSYFYLEFLVAWATRLKDSGFQNPAVLALEYTLVPDGQWPIQINETRAGYKFLCEYMRINPSTICVSGDSAGATLILTLLLHKEEGEQLPRPGIAILVSPWTHLVSELNQNTASDYLDTVSLHLYARQYAGEAPIDGDIISPGLNTHWKQAAPLDGFYIVYGSEEVFAPGIRDMVKNMKRDGAQVKVYQEYAGIHAWPVVNLFLCDKLEDRLKGINLMTNSLATIWKERTIRSKPRSHEK
jgi:acetyl esterase/lipase